MYETFHRHQLRNGESMSSVEDSPARTSAMQEQRKGLMESGQDCGQTMPESFAYLHLDTWLSKTSEHSLFEGSDEFLETWPLAGTMRNGTCYEHRGLCITSTRENIHCFLPQRQRTGKEGVFALIITSSENGVTRLTGSSLVYYRPASAPKCRICRPPTTQSIAWTTAGRLVNRQRQWSHNDCGGQDSAG